MISAPAISVPAVGIHAAIESNVNASSLARSGPHHRASGPRCHLRLGSRRRPRVPPADRSQNRGTHLYPLARSNIHLPHHRPRSSTPDRRRRPAKRRVRAARDDDLLPARLSGVPARYLRPPRYSQDNVGLAIFDPGYGREPRPPSTSGHALVVSTNPGSFPLARPVKKAARFKQPPSPPTLGARRTKERKLSASPMRARASLKRPRALLTSMHCRLAVKCPGGCLG